MPFSIPTREEMEYRTAVPINTITIKVKDVEMPIKSAMAAAMVDAEEPAEIQIEPTAAKMKIKFTILRQCETFSVNM